MSHVYKVPALSSKTYPSEQAAKAAIRHEYNYHRRRADQAARDMGYVPDYYARQLARFPMTIEEFRLEETDRLMSWPPDEEEL